eukprot:6208756-Pleurochrysis_carterae.AAC.2
MQPGEVSVVRSVTREEQRRAASSEARLDCECQAAAPERPDATRRRATATPRRAVAQRRLGASAPCATLSVVVVALHRSTQLRLDATALVSHRQFECLLDATAWHGLLNESP